MSQNRFTPRKSGQQSRARETVEAIVQASRLLVSREGLERLTTNRIAELAGVSVGSLYQYFPGKDAVVHALLERIAANGPLGVAAVREIARLVLVDTDKANERQRHWQKVVFSSEDAQEGARAFVEKRAPDWKGR